MLEVHGTHEPIHSWRSFLTHIGAIAIGLLLALGLEQTVEAIHHRHQRQEIETQIHAALVDDLELDKARMEQLTRLRSYLMDLREAIHSRLTASVRMPAPQVRDPRMARFTQLPRMAPYEAAQRDGTVSLLSPERVGLYDRLSLAHSYLMAKANQWGQSQEELIAFQERFADSQGVPYLGSVATAPVLDALLPPPELNEYLVHVSRAIKETDVIYGYFDLFDLQCRALLAGARTEQDLVDSAVRARPDGFGVEVNNLQPERN